MAKKKLYFDLDGVLYPWQEQFLQYLQLYHGYEGTLETLFYENDWFPKHNELYAWNVTRIETLYETRPPSLKLIAELKRLGEEYELGYITQRPEETRRVTERFLHNYKFPEADNLTMTDDKASAVRMAECDYYVEDRGHIAMTLDKLVKVFLFDQPWNREYQNMFTVIKSIFELQGAINEFERTADGTE